MDEGNEFGLVIGTGLSEDLLKLTTCRGYSYTYRPGSHLQPLPLRNRRDQKVLTNAKTQGRRGGPKIPFSRTFKATRDPVKLLHPSWTTKQFFG